MLVWIINIDMHQHHPYRTDRPWKSVRLSGGARNAGSYYR